jgi:tRNA modification GTPase
LQQVFQIPDGSPFFGIKAGTAESQKPRRVFQVPVDVDLNAGNDSPRLLPGKLFVWPSTQSYTRQPSCEFHTIGSPPLLNKVLTIICQSGARLAQPGEFTLRAFLSGRIDLPQAEAVLSIIDAQAEKQLEVALRQLAGGLSGPLMMAREQLTWILAELEAGLDFAEEDIEFISQSELISRLSEIGQRLHDIQAQMRSRQWSSQSMKVALVGLPNAGKSSIFNALLGSSKAIVSGVSGTTTDFLASQLDLGGILVELTDTAGIESPEPSSDGLLPAIQAQRLRQVVESQVQIKLVCIDGSMPQSTWAVQQLKQLEAETVGSQVSILVLTKGDLEVEKSIASFITDDLRARLEHEHRLVVTQVPSPNQLSELREAIHFQVLNLMEAQTEVVASTLVRTVNSLKSVTERVQRALRCARHRAGEELVAAEIRSALDELGQITGTVYTDDILDLVFSRFCIGK